MNAMDIAVPRALLWQNIGKAKSKKQKAKSKKQKAKSTIADGMPRS